MVELAQELQLTAISEALRAAGWLIPLLQSIHIVTIGVVFVSSAMIALRAMGRMRADEPFVATWQRFAPWMWSGLVVMALTGLLLVVAEPVRELTALSFWIKMVLLAIGVGATVVLARSQRRATSKDVSMAAKSGAIALVALWLIVIFLGRVIAYDVEVWGSLSPQSQSEPEA